MEKRNLKIGGMVVGAIAMSMMVVTASASGISKEPKVKVENGVAYTYDDKQKNWKEDKSLLIKENDKKEVNDKKDVNYKEQMVRFDGNVVEVSKDNGKTWKEDKSAIVEVNDKKENKK